MSYQIICYYFSFPNIHYVDFNDDTNELQIMHHSELYGPTTKIHGFRLMNGYTNTYEDLIRYKNDFKREVTEIKSIKIKNKVTKKFFNLDYTSYYSHKDVVFFFFKSAVSSKRFNIFEPVNEDEFYIYERCLNSGLISLNLEYKNKPTQCYGQDFSRYYPNLMQKLCLPTKAGIKQNLETVAFDKLQFGIYRVKISYTNNKLTNIFNFSKQNHYHSSTLKYLYSIKEQYGITLELLTDDEYDYNAYVYNYEDLIDGDKVFKNWFNMLEHIRNQIPNNTLIKHMMSSLWGTLTSYNKIFIPENETENYDLTYLNDPDMSEYKIIDCKHNDYKCVKPSNAYNYGFARLKPFLTSFARLYIMKFIHKTKTEADVIRIHTDGIVYNKPFDFSSEEYNLTYYPKPEAKTTGYMCYNNAVYGNHKCLKCNNEFNYKTFKCHEC